MLIRPPADNPYDTLKAELIKRTATSEQRKLQQLIGGEELGDRKPTQLLHRMQQLLGDHLGSTSDNAFLKELFLQRLPSNVRMVLASTDTTDLAKLADMADRIVEVAAPQTVSATYTAVPEVEQLKAEITRLTELVDSLTHGPRRSRGRSRDRRPQSQACTDTRTPQSSEPLCWYHQKFGEVAKKCQDPYSWGNE